MEQALSYLNQAEKDVLSKIKMVIVWGYPLHSHTQSYVHYCWHKVFEAFGKKTYWFEDDEFDRSLDYSNCLFIAEGYKDKNIPLHASNLYFINFCIEPQKYLRCGARLFEIRFRVNKFVDINNYWDLKDGTHTLENLSDETLYESLTTNVGVSNDFTGPTKIKMNYEAVYMYWGTDLLPWEINLNDSEFVPENEIVIERIHGTKLVPITVMIFLYQDFTELLVQISTSSTKGQSIYMITGDLQFPADVT
jgi:hypothetical protein